MTLVSVLFNDRCDPEPMIVSFRHKGLARMYQRAERRGVAADLLQVERVLARLDVVTQTASLFSISLDCRFFPVPDVC